jgi:probable phosphoglycerate mutase
VRADVTTPVEVRAERASKPSPSKPTTPARGWGLPTEPPTTLVLVRHGVTAHTSGKLFSGGLAGANPPLTDEGRAQVRATGEWLAPMADAVDALVTSPVRRTRESAEILAEFLEREIEVEEGIAEMEFGAWDGLTFAQVHEQHRDELATWLGDLDHVPAGGESFRMVEKRVLAGRDRIAASYPGKTVVVVSHVTPIKTLVAEALAAPLEAVHRMELAPASVTVISYFHADDGTPRPNLRLYNARPTGAPL